MKISLNNEQIVLLIKQIFVITKLKCFYDDKKNFLFKLIPNYFIFSGSSVDIDCICYIPIKHNYQYYTKMLDIKKFVNIIKSLYESKEIIFIFNENNIEISSKNINFNLSVSEVNNFYYNNDFESNINFFISSDKLKKLINFTKFSIAINDVRMYLNCLYFSIKDNKIKFISSDGYRFSYISDLIDNDQKIIFSGLIPKNSIIELIKILNYDDTIYISILQNKIKFKIKQYVLISKLIDLKFPDYKFLLKKKFNYIFLINRDQLLKSLLRISIFSEINDNIKINFIDDYLILNSLKSNHGYVYEKILINFDKKINIKFLINYKYVIDILNIIKDINIKFSISNDFKYLIISQENKNNFFYLLTIINDN